MPDAVESMFSHRKVPWHGLGTIVQEAPNSDKAIKIAGLDWDVTQRDVYDSYFNLIPGYKANIRSSDNKVLGIVGNRYTVIQNSDAFKFTDELLGDGVTYETAGSLMGGRRIWLLARMPEKYKIAGDDFCNYLVFTNGHDGLNSLKVALTPIRVVCNNTLQVALSNAKRSWSIKHTNNALSYVDVAREQLLMSKRYFVKLSNSMDHLACKKSENENKNMKVLRLILDSDGSLSDAAKTDHFEKIRFIYTEAPDLKDLEHSGYRLLNAVSDYSNHKIPKRYSSSWEEKRFIKAIDGDNLLNSTYKALVEAI